MTNDNAPEKLYAERYPRELEPHYSRHMMAMTAEELHSKSAIAEELAYRDKALDAANARNVELSAEVEALRGLVRAAKCPNCEGEGFTVEPEIEGYDEYGHPHITGVQVQCEWCAVRDEHLTDPEGDQVLREEIEWRKREDAEEERKERER